MIVTVKKRIRSTQSGYRGATFVVYDGDSVLGVCGLTCLLYYSPPAVGAAEAATLAVVAAAAERTAAAAAWAYPSLCRPRPRPPPSQVLLSSTA